MALVRNINLALRAQYLFESNVDYFVYNGDIILIDRITGRMLPGTKLQAGLHQAIEAKEGMATSTDKSVMATITFQNLFKLFESFSGMTATGKLGESEFLIYILKLLYKCRLTNLFDASMNQIRYFVLRMKKYCHDQTYC